MVNIVFYNLNHIGDCYMSSFFINLIVEQNTNINFNYFFIQGDCFIKNRPNISRINKEEFNNSYSRTLQSGEEPEKLINNSFLRFLLLNKFQLSQMRVETYNNTNYLFLNTWCASPIIKHSDFDLNSAFEGCKKLILEVKKRYNIELIFDLKPKIDSIKLFPDYNDYKLKEEEKEKMKDMIFIFNYKPRSVIFNLGIVENYINEQVNNNQKVMIANYNMKYENNNNVLFFDRTFNINPSPDCLNLIKMWDIICYCKKIIILPCGATWTFFHKLEYLRNDQIYMLHGDNYIEKLNNNIRFIDKKSEVQIKKIKI